MADLIVRAGIPEMDDCKVLTRLKAFIVDQGVAATLEHTFRDRKGSPVDLEDWLSTPTSQSASESLSAESPAGLVKLRVKEFLGVGLSDQSNPVWEVDGEGFDPAKGKVRATLEDSMVERPGIYEMSWAIVRNDSDKRPVVVDRGLLSVEKSLFPKDIVNAYKNLGPPTLQEIRMRIMDSSAAENQYLLDDVEFSDDQIMLAITEPVREWNETPPPIRPHYTTRTFPFRGAWIKGVMGQLHLIAAAHYRRNRYAHQAGGTGNDDKNREKEYLVEGQRLWGEYLAWLTNKKIEINLRGFAGSFGSDYGR